MNGFNYHYRRLLRRLLAEGVPRESRGLAHRELPPPTVINFGVGRLESTSQARAVDRGFALVERVSCLSGVGGYPDRIGDYVPRYLDFVEKTGFDAGAYGPRLVEQWPRLYGQLLADPETRQAVVGVWDRLSDCRGDKANEPCTLALQCIRAAGRTLDARPRLDLVVYMRSNDAIWGLAYDAPNFAWLLDVVCGWLHRSGHPEWLGCAPGAYTHVATSMHLYERHVKLARRIVEDPRLEAYELPTWDVAFEDTWATLSLFWQQETAIRVQGRPPESVGSECLDKMLSDLYDYWNAKWLAAGGEA